MNQTELYDSSEIENEIFLSSIPLNLIEEAIKTQFDDPLEYRKTDHVQSFLNKYAFSVDNMYEEDQASLDELHDDFIKFITDIFYEYLGIGMPDIEDKPEEEQHKLIHYTYIYFIKNIKRNFTNLIMNYIDKNREDISSIFVKKKDVIYLNFKSEIPDEFDVLLLSNLSSIIEHILTGEYLIDEFIDLTTTEELCVELEYVKSAFDSFTLTGNFIQPYISMVDKYFRTELESKVRNKILKKYPKRKKEIIVNDENDVTNDESTTTENEVSEVVENNEA
jgi:hypothetical protein